MSIRGGGRAVLLPGSWWFGLVAARAAVGVTNVTLLLTSCPRWWVVIVCPRLRPVLQAALAGVLLEVVVDMGLAVCGPCAGVGASS